MDMKLVNEHDLGTCKITKDLEESYLESCKHNDTTPEDLSYLRSFIWNLLAMIILEQDAIKKHLRELKR